MLKCVAMSMHAWTLPLSDQLDEQPPTVERQGRRTPFVPPLDNMITFSMILSFSHYLIISAPYGIMHLVFVYWFQLLSRDFGPGSFPIKSSSRS
jgi:hypothetical protein